LYIVDGDSFLFVMIVLMLLDFVSMLVNVSCLGVWLWELWNVLFVCWMCLGMVNGVDGVIIFFFSMAVVVMSLLVELGL